jgi:ABC-type branched-subunit amino acid transport system ATPase component
MLDEPTEGVWIGVVEGFAERLSELSREMSILIVEQHFDLVLKIADRVDVTDRWQIVISEPPDEVNSHADFLRLLAP